jgi:hypothetical protein
MIKHQLVGQFISKKITSGNYCVSFLSAFSLLMVLAYAVTHMSNVSWMSMFVCFCGPKGFGVRDGAIDF